MAATETLGILEEIESLVSDQLQVVSYKWLSRNFLVSSNAAKRLLKEFVEKHGRGFEVVYSLSGWLKNNPSSYHIRLVSGSKLAEAEHDFDGKCSIQVYSVQASIPKDPAALWNAEFVQAEELFKQPSAIDNCLRDNRFCGISNSLITRNVEGTQVSIPAPQTKSAGLSGVSKSSSSPKVGLQSLTGLKDAKSENGVSAIHDQSTASSLDKEKVPSLPANKKKGQDEKSTSGTGGSLANLWGRASSKPKHDSAPMDDSNHNPDTTDNGKTQLSTHGAGVAGGGDDEVQDVNFRRASNGDTRKRKVVFDLSDEEDEDVVSLASPGVPKEKSGLDAKGSPKDLISERPDSAASKTKNTEPKVKEEGDNKESNKSLCRDSSVVSKSTKANTSSSEKIQTSGPEVNMSRKDQVIDAPPTSPKRRKVLKTRIDERGREVTEVVWEGENSDAKKIESDAKKKEESSTTKKSDDKAGVNAINRPLVSKKSSTASGNAAASNAGGGKAGNKKGGNAKDPKQGNILSFFKRV